MSINNELLNNSCASGNGEFMQSKQPTYGWKSETAYVSEMRYERAN
jgi:hypothetical protein